MTFRVSDEKKAEAVRLVLEEGWTYSAVSAHLGVAAASVRRWVALAQPGHRRQPVYTDAQKAKVLQLALVEKVPHSEISARLGIPQSAIALWLKKRGPGSRDSSSARAEAERLMREEGLGIAAIAKRVRSSPATVARWLRHYLQNSPTVLRGMAQELKTLREQNARLRAEASPSLQVEIDRLRGENAKLRSLLRRRSKQ